MSNIISFFTRADVAYSIFTLFICSVLYYLYKKNALNKFLKFGPDEKNPAEFIGMKIDNWEKVIFIISFSFVLALMSSYIGTVMYEKIWRHMSDDVSTESIESSHSTSVFLQVISPILWKLEEILEFYVKSTFQLQFLLPDLIGSMLIDLPYDLYKASKKNYINT